MEKAKCPNCLASGLVRSSDDKVVSIDCTLCNNTGLVSSEVKLDFISPRNRKKTTSVVSGHSKLLVSKGFFLSTKKEGLHTPQISLIYGYIHSLSEDKTLNLDIMIGNSNTLYMEMLQISDLYGLYLRLGSAYYSKYDFAVNG